MTSAPNAYRVLALEECGSIKQVSGPVNKTGSEKLVSGQKSGLPDIDPRSKIALQVRLASGFSIRVEMSKGVATSFHPLASLQLQSCERP